ncbi:MAG TPA: glycosyltransferase family 2 protein [Thermoanaerobaculia bacterium]|jgi:glycosyltransferase involved in cell wall biosynthesis
MSAGTLPSPAPTTSAARAEELEVSIVMPCLNEAETLAVCIRKARSMFAAHGVRGEVIVADNGSTDGSQEIARAEGARVVNVADKGYGNALRGGILEARGRFVLMADADDSYDFAGSFPLVAKLREGFDLVMGNRFRGGIEPGAMPPLHRYLGNPVLTAIGRLFFRSPVRDFHCGLRGFTKAAFERMELRTTGMEFASEMVVKASLLDMRIAEVPVTLTPDGRSRRPHLRTWRDGWRHLRFLLLYSPRWLFLYPGLALMVIGAAAGLWLIPGPREVNGVGFDIQTLLYAGVAVLLGFQAVVFAVFTKVYAISAGLLPQDRRVERVLRLITLEAGLIIGFLLVMFGLGGSLFAVGVWGKSDFSALNPSESMRIIVPSVVALTLGAQVILSSFFLSVLGMRRR